MSVRNIGIWGDNLSTHRDSSVPDIGLRMRLKPTGAALTLVSMHVHVHGAGGPTRVLKISLAVTLCYIVLLVVAGIRAHSLALLSEAGHNLSDFLALLLSLVAVYFQSRPASSTKTYGYHRAGVLAALVNATSLVAVSCFIFYEAFKRLQHPEHVQAGVMMWVAAAGVVMNGVIALLLYRSGGDINIRSALLHEVGDTLSTAAVIAGGWAILVTGNYWIDSGAVARDWRADLVVGFWHCARDPQHPAGGYPARHEAGEDRVRHP